MASFPSPLVAAAAPRPGPPLSRRRRVPGLPRLRPIRRPSLAIRRRRPGQAPQLRPQPRPLAQVGNAAASARCINGVGDLEFRRGEGRLALVLPEKLEAEEFY